MTRNKNKNKKVTTVTVVEPKKVATQKKKKQVNPVSKMFTFSHCALKYAKAVLDPINAPAGACIPSSLSMISHKLRTFSKGTLAAGTTGFGYIVVDPFSGASSTPSWGSKTGTTFTGTTVSASSATTGVTAIAASTPYSSSNFGTTGGSARLVGCGIRVRYIGQQMYRSGCYYAGMNPTHQTLSSYSANDFMQVPDGIKQVPIGNDWVTAYYIPTTPADLNEYLPATSNTVTAVPILAIAFDGVNTNGNSFQYEVVGHYEVFGRNIASGSPSESDPVGFGAVTNYLAHLTNFAFSGDGPNMGAILNRIVSMASAASTYIPVGIRALNAARGVNPQSGRNGPMIEEM